MNGVAGRFFIENVVIFHPFGAYLHDVPKLTRMFESMNPYRAQRKRPFWEIRTFEIESAAISALEELDPIKTLIAIAAGPASSLEKNFSFEGRQFLKNYLERGAKLLSVCGSSYMIASKRVYQGISKVSSLPLFKGVAEGPLCPDAKVVELSSGKMRCCMYMSGGGSLTLSSPGEEERVLVEYVDEKEKNAVVLARLGKGAVLLSMPHPEYDPQDIEVGAFQKCFPQVQVNWGEIKKKLSPLEERIQFVLHTMIFPLEDSHIIQKLPEESAFGSD